LNLPAGPSCQQPRATESVSANSVHSIRTEIDSKEPSSPSRRGLDKTLALATGESRATLTEGHRGRLGWLQGGGGLSEVSSVSEACRRRCSRWCVVVLVCVVLEFRQRWRRPHAAREETRCGVRFRSSRGREGCREREQREMVDVDQNLHRLPLLRRRSSSSAARGMDGARRWGALGGEERGWGKNGVQGKSLADPVGFIPRRWTQCSWFRLSRIGQWGSAFWMA
jgi:hypothetical protein